MNRWNSTYLPTWILIICVLFPTCQVALSEAFDFTLQINSEEKLIAAGIIQANTPIEVKIEKKLLKKHEDFSYYSCKIQFSRIPSLDEIKRLKIAIFPESDLQDPIGFGTIFTEVLWKDIRDNLLKIYLKRGQATLLQGETPNKRLMIFLKSESGYRKQNVTATDSNGNYVLQWETPVGKASIKVTEEKDYEQALKNHQSPSWKEWEFEVFSSDKSPIFVPKKPRN